MASCPRPDAPVSTYRLQLTPSFGFDDAAGIVDYLADLGVTHLYCSPWLQAAPGSAHGYDVVDHSRVNDELGGPAALRRLHEACGRHGLGIVLDIVPNHMCVGAPETGNAAWWSVLAEGPSSPYAHWFDIDWAAPDNPGKVLVPILAGPLAECLSNLEVDADRIRYHEHVLPLAPGSLVADDLLATLAAQHYRLCHWRVGTEELNYRRFFDVQTLAGVRVEDPRVFEATHATVLGQLRDGVVDGLRVDHPDGLADPGGYLDRLADASGDAWVVVEKILEPGEALPASWRCAGTTGYDALNLVTGLFVEPSAEAPLRALWESLSGGGADFDTVAVEAKRQVLHQVLPAEVTRVSELGLRVCRADPGLQDTTRRGLHDALLQVLASMSVYRAYLPAEGGGDALARRLVGEAVAAAREALPERAPDIDTVGRLALHEGPDGPDADEFVVRFQQTCGPVMAKGVEDTAFYRYLPLVALNEVGGHPGHWGTSVDQFHEACTAMARDWPTTMTTLSTHDTKRSEDVRARLATLTEIPVEWGEAVTAATALARGYGHGLDAGTQQLLWQTVFGAWPLSPDRAVAYLLKAVREAKLRTSWLDPDLEYERAVEDWVRAVLADHGLVGHLGALVERHRAAWETTVLAQKLVQLTMPGVADTYQGCELPELSLVDPDNRRPVDYPRRRRLLHEPVTAETRKLHLVAVTLRLRRAEPEVFLAGGYQPLESAARSLAFLRGGRVATVVPTRAVQLGRHGWGGDLVHLPEGSWRDRLTGRVFNGGAVPLAELLSDWPVALLVSERPGAGTGRP
ncbi:MAG: malto-oligosyltrehalose synthase [Actinomycetota bacterium]|nr:malto-oligosyltrehalose synthase [Actinomycetota bacterium]